MTPTKKLVKKIAFLIKINQIKIKSYENAGL